ncbi:MAG: protein translocase subunit SecD, partial [Dehalococcoidia bacterium]
MRDRANRLLLVVVVLLTIFSVIVVWPANPKRYFPSFIPWPHGQGLSINGFTRDSMRLGLDLRGGVRTVVQAQPPAGFDPKNLASAMTTAIDIYNRRVNKFGLTEAEVTKQGSDKIVVDVPGITADDAKNLIGKTAELSFKEPILDASTGKQATDASGQPTWQPACQDLGCPNNEPPLTGRFLKPNSFVSTNAGGQPQVNFEFGSEGAKIFGAVTQRNIGKPVAIFLDKDLITSPIVNSQITSQGQITGANLNATQLVAQLNAGALPLPFNVVQQTTVDATLGKDSVNKSVFAGEIGFLAVAFFMIAFYRLPGVLATLALTVYSFIVLMIFKLVPVTLTLPGIAAFVLSIGIAVDANILIFERTKEELRAGRGLNSAIDHGFSRAWTSIRDSNVSTIITSLILFYFGDQFGAALVKGFALNLAIGVGISLFSSILVTRVFLLLTVGTRLGRSRWMFGAQRPQYAKRPEEVVRAQRRVLPAALNLVGNRKWYFLLSFLITIPGLISLLIPPTLRPGIEFTSGTTFTLRFQQPPNQTQVADQLRTYGFGDPTVTTQSGNTYKVAFSQPPSSEALQAKLAQDFSIEGGVTATSNGAQFRLKTPPAATDVRTELQALSAPSNKNATKDARVQGSTNNELIVRVKEIPGNVTSTDVGPAEPTALDGITAALIAKFGHLTDAQNRV